MTRTAFNKSPAVLTVTADQITLHLFQPHQADQMQAISGLFARSEREREIHYIFSSHLRADQMCRGSFLGSHQ